MLLTTEDGTSHVGLVPQVKRRLEESGFLLEDLSIERVGAWGKEMFTTATKSENGQKYLGVCRVPPPFGQKVRRVDFFSCPIDQYQCARLTCESSNPEPLANRSGAAVQFANVWPEPGAFCEPKGHCCCIRRAALWV